MRLTLGFMWLSRTVTMSSYELAESFSHWTSAMSAMLSAT